MSSTCFTSAWDRELTVQAKEKVIEITRRVGWGCRFPNCSSDGGRTLGAIYMAIKNISATCSEYKIAPQLVAHLSHHYRIAFSQFAFVKHSERTQQS